MKFVHIDDRGEEFVKQVEGNDWKQIIAAELDECVNRLIADGYVVRSGAGWNGIMDQDGETEYYVCEDHVDMWSELGYSSP